LNGKNAVVSSSRFKRVNQKGEKKSPFKRKIRRLPTKQRKERELIQYVIRV